MLPQHRGCHVLPCMSRNTGQINPAGLQSFKSMYYIHVILIIKWFWLDLTWIPTFPISAVHLTGKIVIHVDGLVQERRNSIANALELRLSCTSMNECKKGVTPLLTHWSYVFLALTHRRDDHYGPRLQDGLNGYMRWSWPFGCSRPHITVTARDSIHTPTVLL